MAKKINIKKVQIDAEELFRSGGFFCSEAIVASIKKNIAPEMPGQLISAASGFPVGVGGSKCICGAISGAVICLGYFFGRTESASSPDPKSQKCMALVYELQDSFRKNHNGVLCCSVLTQGMDMGSEKLKEQCISFTGEMAAKTAEILARELKKQEVSL